MTDIYYHKRKFFNTAVADIYRALDGKSYIGGFTLTFCLLDYLAWLEFGGGNVKENYLKWTKQRLIPLNNFYTGQEEELYSVRCALIHTYGPSQKITNKRYAGYKLSFNNCGMHMQKVNNDILQLCLYSLLTEIVFAAHLFFEEINSAQLIQVQERLNNQIVIIDSEPPELYSQMHTALSVLDYDSVTLNDIQGDFTTKMLYPDLN